MDSHVGWHTAERIEVEADIQSLASLRKGQCGIVTAVGLDGDGGVTIGDVAGSTIARRLLEIGFVPGERVEIIEEIRPGRDPVAVRVGSSMFALRRREALAVWVRLTPPEAV
jgi:ferrous iron transport protein A